MERRNFIKAMLLAAVAPSVLLPRLADHHRWKRTGNLWVRNPAWETAKYEVFYLQQPGIYDPAIFTGEWSFVTGTFNGREVTFAATE
jgi:hypothetical protein